VSHSSSGADQEAMLGELSPETPASPPRSRRKHTRGATVRTKPADVERMERDLRCVELRKAGLTWQAIADRLGYASAGHAYTRFMVVMKEWPREDIETTRNLISDRYEAMLRALWPEVLSGKWLAIDRATRILENLAKLHGANRPEKIEITPGETALDQALRELQEELQRRAARDGSPVPQE